MIGVFDTAKLPLTAKKPPSFFGSNEMAGFRISLDYIVNGFQYLF
jgi:hypothetical protein